MSAGIVISASHNPWHDSRIKVLAPTAKLRMNWSAIEADILPTSSSWRVLPKLMQPVTMLPGDEAARMQVAGVAGRPGNFAAARAGDVRTARRAAWLRWSSRTATSGRLLHIDPMGATSMPDALHPDHVASGLRRRRASMTWASRSMAMPTAMFSDAAGNVVNGDGVLLLAA